MAKDKTISYRPDPEILARIETVQHETGKKYLSETLAELVQAGLDARTPPTRSQSDPGPQLTRLVGLLERLTAEAATPRPDPVALDAIAGRLDRLPAALLDEMDARLGRLAELLAEDVADIRKGLRTAVGNFIRLAYPKLEPEKIIKLVNEAFES